MNSGLARFFGGKRFVPIATGFFCLVLAAILGYVWPPVRLRAIHAGGELESLLRARWVPVSLVSSTVC
ncbi:hypothetical protein ACLK19_04615 [Escherichia coli]